MKNQLNTKKCSNKGNEGQKKVIRHMKIKGNGRSKLFLFCN